jgi:hypothetical protein
MSLCKLPQLFHWNKQRLHHHNNKNPINALTGATSQSQESHHHQNVYNVTATAVNDKPEIF